MVTILIFTVLFFQACQRDNPADEGKAVASVRETDKPRILFINSYDPEYFWSIGIMNGIFSAYNLPWTDEGEISGEDSPVLLKVHHMRTLVNHSSDDLKKAVEETRDIISSWNPDVVIASDDNASKYLIAPYYIDNEIPFVFCGLNWNIDIYGFPASNITGMISVHQTRDIVEALLPYAEGENITYLRSDDGTSEEEINYLKNNLPYPLSAVLVETYEEWKEEFVRLQDKTNIILVGSPSALSGWDGKNRRLHCFILENTRIPTGSWYNDMTGNVLMSIINRAEEQGQWAAERALEISRGKSPSEIPVTQNKHAAKYLNMELANKMGILFPVELIQTSHLVNTVDQCKKIYFVNSYHRGYTWSDKIEAAMEKALSQSGIHYNLKIFRMDSKNNKSDSFIRGKAEEAYGEIEAWEPDIILGSDDNFLNYLVLPYFLEKEYPVLYCGLNGYNPEMNLPNSHISGMIEVELLETTKNYLRYYAKGDRLGFLFQEENFNHIIYENLLSDRSITIEKAAFAADFEEWKSLYSEMQDSTDMLILYNPIGLKGWNEEEAYDFILNNTSIPVGTTLESSIRLALLGNIKVPEELGWWLGEAAAEVLSGTPVENIPQAVNRQSKLIINTDMANHLGYVFPMEMMEEAQMWPGEQLVQ